MKMLLQDTAQLLRERQSTGQQLNSLFKITQGICRIVGSQQNSEGDQATKNSWDREGKEEE